MLRTLGQFASILAAATYLLTALPGAAGLSLHRHGSELVHVHADHADHGHVHDVADGHHDGDPDADGRIGNEESLDLTAEILGLPSESIYDFDSAVAVVRSDRDLDFGLSAQGLAELDAPVDYITPTSLFVSQAASRADFASGQFDLSDSTQRILQRNHALLL